MSAILTTLIRIYQIKSALIEKQYKCRNINCSWISTVKSLLGENQFQQLTWSKAGLSIELDYTGPLAYHQNPLPQAYLGASTHRATS